MKSQLDREFDEHTASIEPLNPIGAARVRLEMINQQLATKISNTDIAPRFSSTNKYNALEQQVINHAIEILASKIICQDKESELTSAIRTKQFLQLKLATSEREIFAVIFLNGQNRVIEYEEMFIGTIDSASVYPREIVKRALDLNAANIILAHNHPSDTLDASQADDLITQRVFIVARLFNIQVLDHIIVSPAGTYSYADHQKMPC